MVDAQLNIFDTVVLGILILSSLIAFFRGFVKEVLSLGAWVGSAIVTVYAFPSVAEWIKPQVSSPVVASGMAALGTYIACLLVISLINSIILKYVKAGSDVGILDNMLGLLFGAARGAFVVSLGFLLMTVVIGDNYPDWVKEAQTKEYVEKGSDMLSKLAPEYMTKMREKKDEGGALDSDIQPSSGETTVYEKGYRNSNIRDLDRLINTEEQ